MRARWLMMVLFVLAAGSGAVRAQWLNYPTPGIPRLANGAPDLKAPAPRTPDGKPDFSGTTQIYEPESASKDSR